MFSFKVSCSCSSAITTPLDSGAKLLMLVLNFAEIFQLLSEAFLWLDFQIVGTLSTLRDDLV